jgi:hypothetical protein
MQFLASESHTGRIDWVLLNVLLPALERFDSASGLVRLRRNHHINAGLIGERDRFIEFQSATNNSAGYLGEHGKNSLRDVVLSGRIRIRGKLGANVANITSKFIGVVP